MPRTRTRVGGGPQEPVDAAGCNGGVAIVRIVVAALFVAWLAGGVADAKSPPTKVMLTGPGLPQPAAITDGASIEQFNPWGRQFIDWQRGLAADRPQLSEAYVVSIYANDGASPAYTVYYAPRADGTGLLYFPGPGDAHYRANIGTIMGASSSDRWNPEGKWQFATRQADEALRGAIAQQAVVPPAANGASTASPLVWGSGGLALIVALAIITRVTMRRTTRLPTPEVA